MRGTSLTSSVVEQRVNDCFRSVFFCSTTVSVTPHRRSQDDERVTAIVPRARRFPFPSIPVPWRSSLMQKLIQQNPERPDVHFGRGALNPIFRRLMQGLGGHVDHGTSYVQGRFVFASMETCVQGFVLASMETCVGIRAREHGEDVWDYMGDMTQSDRNDMFLTKSDMGHRWATHDQE